MNTHKNFTSALTLLLILNTNLFGDGTQDIIPGASYYVIDKADEFCGVRGGRDGSKFVDFYSYDGRLLKRLEGCYIGEFDSMRKKLDPQAPKPQPISCKIKYWPALEIKILPFCKPATKGVPGNMILFYDRHGNVIERYRYNKEKKSLTFPEHINNRICAIYHELWLRSLQDLKLTQYFPLDLSKIDQIEDLSKAEK